MKLMALQIDSMTLTRKCLCFVEKHNSSAKKLSKLRYKFKKLRIVVIYPNSERKYLFFKKLTELNKILPSINHCLLIKNQINSYFDIEENDVGFYLLNLAQMISLSILNYYKRNNNQILEIKIRIKIACDSTKFKEYETFKSNFLCGE